MGFRRWTSECAKLCHRFYNVWSAEVLISHPFRETFELIPEKETNNKNRKNVRMHLRR